MIVTSPLRWRLRKARQSRFRRIAQQIDDQLFNLVGIELQHDIRPRLELDRYPGFKRDRTLHQRVQRNRLQCGRRQLGKLPVSLDETIERFRAILNNFQTTVQAEHLIIDRERIHGLHLQRIDMDPRTKAAGNGFDGGQRIVDFVANHPDQALPGIALLLPQGNADVRQHQQRVRDAALAKTRPPDHPMDGIAFAAKNHDSAIGLIEQVSKPQIVRAASQGPLLDEMEDALRGGIDRAAGDGRDQKPVPARPWKK